MEKRSMRDRMIIGMLALCGALITMMGCSSEESDPSPRDTVVVHDTTVVIDTGATASAPPLDTNALPITLPVLDAFFADSAFAGDIKSRLALTDAQVDSLRMMAREETSKLSESDTGSNGRGMVARQHAMDRINAIVGPEKGSQLMALLRERWTGGTSLDSVLALGNRVPSDTRIVVNAPAYRMDLFEDGKLVRTYDISIGYPEFPLPTGNRVAKSIIFNPTWIPPDEPWVESSKKVKVGQKVPAGNKLNPLGIAKIPIGLPSLIHGGKKQAQIGRFGSHGCVGLTDRQMRELSMEIAKMGDAEVTDSMINSFGKNRTVTKTVDLKAPVPVELRYQTIVVVDGKLHIYRDVYNYNSNTEGNLRTVLASYGVNMEQLSDSERTETVAALRSMSHDGKGATDTVAASPDTTSKGKATAQKKKTTTKSPQKNQKEIVIEIAALKGKGYPAPVNAAPPASKQIVRR